MTINQIQNQIEELEKQMRELEPNVKKASSIVRMAVPGGISLFGLIAFLYTLLIYFLESQFVTDETGFIIAMIIFGAIFLLGAISCLTGIPQLKKMKVRNNEYNKLEDEKKSLEKKLKVLAKSEIIETKDDTLLRLLSEGKLTLEEYKQLSNKK